MTSKESMIEMQRKIAKRAAQELHGPLVVNLGIGIPTYIVDYLEDESVVFHTENGLLGVGPKDEANLDPNLVNAGKTFVTALPGASYFSSADSFAMIRGGHIDAVVLGVLQVEQSGRIANWSVPGKNIIGVGGAMDLIEGAKRVIVTMTHTTKDGEPKILKSLTYPKTSERSVEMIITELAVFEVVNHELHLIELMPGVTLEEVVAKTEAEFVNKLK